MNNTLSAAQGMEAKASRESHVASEMQELRNTVSGLEETIAALFTKLESVRLDAPSRPCDEAKSAPESPLVPLADSIRDLRRRLTQAIRRIEELTNSIEL